MTEIDDMRLAVSQAPGDPLAWERLGDLLGSAQRLVEALAAYERARALEPRNLAFTMKAAIAASCLGRLHDARTMLEQVMRIAPLSDAFLKLFLDVLEAERDWTAVENLGRAWSERAPEQARAWDARARAAWETGWLHQSMEFYRKAMALTAPDAGRLASYARICLNALEFDAAEQALTQAEALDPRNVHMLSARAGLLTFMGRFEDAESYCRRGLALDPNDVSALRVLSQVKRGRLSADERANLARLAAQTDLRVEHRISAAFTLGDSLDAENDIDAAFAAYEHAHHLASERGRIEHLQYEPLAREREIDLLIAHFADTPVPATNPTGPRPIFIIGMPRSGTTLIESVLGAHSRVVACGERTAMRQVMREYSVMAATPAGVPADALVRLAQAYFEDLPALHGADCITDKNPWNFDAVGLILQLFPEARIVHVRRDPIETSLSIFRNEFSKFQPFSNRLEDIGHYYGQYFRLMAHWLRIAGDRIVTVQYEDFAANFADAAPALLQSCGLEWQDACASFQTSRKVIATLSTVQAREPVTDRSGRAARYERHLAALVAALSAAGIDRRTV